MLGSSEIYVDCSVIKKELAFLLYAKKTINTTVLLRFII